MVDGRFDPSVSLCRSETKEKNAHGADDGGDEDRVEAILRFSTAFANGCPSVGYDIDELAAEEGSENRSDEAGDEEETKEAKFEIVRRLSECSIGGELKYKIPKSRITTGCLMDMVKKVALPAYKYPNNKSPPKDVWVSETSEGDTKCFAETLLLIIASSDA